MSLLIVKEDFEDFRGIFFGFLVLMAVIGVGALFYLYQNIQKAADTGLKKVIVGAINEKIEIAARGKKGGNLMYYLLL